MREGVSIPLHERGVWGRNVSTPYLKITIDRYIMSVFLPKTQFDHVYAENVLEKVYLRNKMITYIKSDNCIGHFLKHGHYWEEWMFNYIKQHYVEHTNIIDLGGNIGTTTLLMSEVLSKDCKVFTFEPIYSDILLQNIIENQLTDRVTVYPYGVGNKIETLKIKPIHLLENINFGGVSIIRTLENNDNSLPIHIVPLDHFHFEKVSLLKIDVEHMEIQVLEGCIELIKRCKPTILIETYQLQEVAQTNVFKEIMSLGYEISIMPEGCNDYIMKIKTA